MKLLTDIKDYDLKNARVLVRVDYNVSLKDGKVVNDERIKASLDTINFLREKGSKIILMTHFGRPEGRVDKKYSLLPIANHLEDLLNQSISFAADIFDSKTEAMIEAQDNGDILMLENLRFYPQEEANGAEFAKRLAGFATIYVNDAFSVSHRAHASVDAVPKLMDAYAGFQFQKEVEALSKVIECPKKPVVAIVGGKKVSDKINALEHYLGFVDVILVGGGAANIFLDAEGYEIGSSFLETGYEDFISDLIYDAEQKDIQIMIPDDVFVSKEIKENYPKKLKDVAALAGDDVMVDIGVETINKFKEIIAFAGTIIWTGPLGIFEIGADEGTNEIAKAVADSGAYSVIGGGDTITSIHKNLRDKFGFVSTAGGATMAFLAGKKLPGIEAVS